MEGSKKNLAPQEDTRTCLEALKEGEGERERGKEGGREGGREAGRQASR